MTAIHHDAHMSDRERRERLYAGDLFVYGPTDSSRRLIRLACDMAAQAFAPRDPQRAQFELPVAEYAAVLAQLKPAFIHHPECKEIIPQLLEELGCDSLRTYFDVPRMRTATSDNYLTTGIAYAFHPHRDTWYSAPFCQLNWWIPVYPLHADNCMAFHPQHWSQPLRNSSSEYDYAEWNRTSRYQAAQHIGSDTRKQPRAEESVEVEPDVRLLPPPGGIIVFSAAQLHSTVPNTTDRTRFSIDFRTVHIDDAVDRRGAPNIDSECTGTTMRDYLRCADLAHLPDHIIAAYERGGMDAAIDA